MYRDIGIYYFFGDGNYEFIWKISRLKKGWKVNILMD